MRINPRLDRSDSVRCPRAAGWRADRVLLLAVYVAKQSTARTAKCCGRSQSEVSNRRREAVPVARAVAFLGRSALRLDIVSSTRESLIRTQGQDAEAADSSLAEGAPRHGQTGGGR
jgi:hypothetical protein